MIAVILSPVERFSLSLCCHLQLCVTFVTSAWRGWGAHGKEHTHKPRYSVCSSPGKTPLLPHRNTNIRYTGRNDNSANM